MAALNLLYKNRFPINEHIAIEIPTVGQILENEEGYFETVSVLTATPYDMMVHLDDIGIDFTEINDYDLFLLIFNSLKLQDMSLVFGDLDTASFEVTANRQNGTLILRSEANGAVIDRSIHSQICHAIRAIHHFKRNTRKPGNRAAKQYMLQRAREKMKRRRNKTEPSRLEELIVALVNTEQFHYGFEDVKDLTIYQFNESVQQIIKKIDYDNKMRGVYAGTISAKDMSQDDLNWLTHKNREGEFS